MTICRKETISSRPVPQVLMTFFVLFFTAAALLAQDATALLEEADRIFELENIYSRSTLSIIRNGREQSPQTMEGFESEANDGTARSLSIFNEPARVAGTAYLMIGDDLWVRFASTGRIRKMSSSAKKNSAAGSDFSYADMGEGSDSFTSQYEAVYDGTERLEGTDCHRLILAPRSGERDAYEKLIVWITVDEGRYHSIEYWDRGAATKVMTLEDYRPVGGLFYPFRITMHSLAKDSVSIITTDRIEPNSPKVEERYFSTSYLEGIR